MIFYCDAHNTTHSLTPGQTERVVYALSGEVATALCEPDGDRIYAGENAWEKFPCLLDYLGLSDSPEGYLELVESWVAARRAVTPIAAAVPDEAAVLAAASGYGIAPDEFSTDDVRTAQALWQAIKPQFDPNDAWEYTEIGPLLRTFLAVLTTHRPEHFAHELAARDYDRARQLYQAVYPGDAWPDRPVDTVWNHLLDQVRVQVAQQLALRAAAIKAADQAEAVTGDNASLVEVNQSLAEVNVGLVEVNESLGNRLRDSLTALNGASSEAVEARRQRDEAFELVEEMARTKRDLLDEIARLRHALLHQDQIARTRTVLSELSPSDAAAMVRGLEDLLADYDQAELLVNTPHDPAEDGQCTDPPASCCADAGCPDHGDHDPQQYSACVNGLCNHSATSDADDEVLT